MKTSWFSSSISIALIYMFRMLGLFLLIPVFTVYAINLHSATPQLIGIALGSYGLSQGLLQIPFGWLSDKYGRKSIITFGLLLFAIGSLIGAYSHSIYGMILARIIQGTGAIGSALMALLTDLTEEEHRTKAMAIIGVTIGMSFSLAMILSPVIAQHYGLSGIFYFTACLAIAGIFVLYYLIPNPSRHTTYNNNRFYEALCNIELQKLNFGIFCQHLILTATFFSIPMILKTAVLEQHITQAWHFYIPLMLGAFIVMLPGIIIADKFNKSREVFLIAILLTVITQFILIFQYQSWMLFCGVLFIYFVSFNLLEANLPALISKKANANAKGTAMGIYSSSQFLGIFAGGVSAGFMFKYANHQGIFIFNSVIATIWFLIAKINNKK